MSGHGATGRAYPVRVRPPDERKANRDARAAERARVAAALLEAFHLPTRAAEPETVIAHLGPTNSGKSHDALAFLLEHGAGTYAAPLRLLAREGWEKLRRQLPDGRVGLVTGEERIHPGAPILCCTTELAPLRGDVLVLDEVHWVDDPDRGWAWGRLLAGASYRHVRLVGAANAEPVLRAAYGDALEVRSHRRLVELSWAGTVEAAGVPAGSLVVAFSRKAVLALAREVAAAAGLRTGVLYGALPPGARIAQIDRFLAGELDVLCVTDVIGHGINLPAERVVVAESSKFDGTRRRPLHVWELAQIVGRAGRFGLSERGDVSVLRGVPGLEANATLVRQATDAAGGSRAAGPAIAHALIRPAFDDLGAATGRELVDRIAAWQSVAREALARHAWLRAAPLDREAALLAQLDRRGLAAGLDAVTLWRLATTPADDPEVVVELAAALHSPGRGLRRAAPERAPDTWSLEDAERAAGRARGLAAVARSFPQLSIEPPEALVEAEQRAASRILEVLPTAISSSPHGRCGSCGRPCAPWVDRCDRCRGTRPRLPPPRRRRR